MRDAALARWKELGSGQVQDGVNVMGVEKPSRFNPPALKLSGNGPYRTG